MEQPANNIETLIKKNILHIQDVYKQYEGKTILNDIDLSVAKSELCTLVGPSGCGKSTLLKLILGQERPTSGNILIEGKPVGFADTHRGIVYQKYSLFPHLSVIENVMLGKKLTTGLFGLFRKRNEIKDEAVEYLRKVRLEEHYNKYPHELSGGMQQRVAIVQSLIMKPKILLMDEPFGALDPGTREDMQMFLLELWEDLKMNIFFVTHDLEEAVFLGTRVIVISQHYISEKTPNKGGSKIVADYPLQRIAQSTLAKSSAYYRDLIVQIRREGFEPQYLQHLEEFNLRHPDSFQTL
ncbi:ABC-type nitrate/sulfonate/bicarbonate transport system, ATPase component [Candidatus Magnetoovum chiemensis]|nr:ABC-type nitrate/sulfonate/bicarbonate transport system, ATPase component [Candidatus Magnetoovum chiemensis]